MALTHSLPVSKWYYEVRDDTLSPMPLTNICTGYIRVECVVFSVAEEDRLTVGFHKLSITLRSSHTSSTYYQYQHP